MPDTAGDDNSLVGRVTAHPKAALAARPAARPAPSVAGRMLLAVLAGALFGLLLSVVIAPAFSIAFAIFGAMSFGAGTVVLFMLGSSTPARDGGLDQTDTGVLRK